MQAGLLPRIMAYAGAINTVENLGEKRKDVTENAM
jgi:hypothetical protein